MRRAIIASMTRKQREVLEALHLGFRYLALCCGRRAGKTTFLAKLIILTLLDCQRKEAIFYVAWSLKIGVGLIWQDLAKECEVYGLDEYWSLSEHDGEISTPAGATFFIMGLNVTRQSNRGRGFKGRLFCIDESQDVEHLLAKTLTAISPGLTDTRGAFLAAGTGPYVTQGTWYEWSVGKQGFKAFNWTVLDNEKFPQDPVATLAEERERNTWDEDHPDYVREWLGKAADDVEVLLCEFLAERNTITELPLEYNLGWRHVIGMDFGWDDAITWVVVAANPYGPERIVVHAEGASKMTNDDAAEKTAELVQQFHTTYVVCDPGGGGKGFFEAFNSKQGKKLHCQITGAYKLGKVDSVKVINTDLRCEPPENDNGESMFGEGKARLVVLLPAAAPLAHELKVLRWKDKKKGEVLTSKTSRDDHFDGFRYACDEIAPWQEKAAPSAEKTAQEIAAQKYREQLKNDVDAREREQRNRAARKASNASQWWGQR